MVAVGTLAWLSPAHAFDVMNTVAGLLASIAQILIELIGKIFTVLIEILLAVVQYNDFINAPAVVKGWVLVRDVANMAFLIIFIAIAFATILGIEKYEYKQLLPKLLIMAVLINFSRTICGIIIDAAQVVMITFVNGFKDVAAGNLIRGFGVTDMLTLRDLGEGEGVTGTALAAASILAVAMLVIATVTVGIMVLMFVVRIIYLWILIVLSPFAFMLSAAPGFSGKFNEWWDKFARYVFIGPLLAFFLWLSFSIMASVDPGQNLATQNKINFSSATSASGEGMAGRTSAAITAVSRSDNLLSFGIAIALLLLALSTANSIGVAGGKLAGTAMAKIQSGGIKLGKLAGIGLATGGLGLAAYGAYKGAKGIKKVSDKTGLTSFGLNWADKKWGYKATRLGGKIVSKLGFTKKQRAIGRAYAKFGTRVKDIVPLYKKFKDLKNKEEYSVRDAQLEDALHAEYRGRKTNRAFVAAKNLANERVKELSEDEGDQNEVAKSAIKQMKAGKKGAETDYIAARIALKRNNGDNTFLRDKEIAPEVVANTIRRMGDIQESRITAQDAAGHEYSYAEAEEEFEEAKFRDSFRNQAKAMAEAKAKNLGLAENTPEWDGYVDFNAEKIMDEIYLPEWEKQKSGIMETYAADYAKKTAQMSVEDKRKFDEQLQDEIGTRLYAQQYDVYNFDQAGNKSYAKKIAESTGKDENGYDKWQIATDAHGLNIDENGNSVDMGTYIGGADALHEQTSQMIYGELMKKSNSYMTDEIAMEFSRELDGENLKNNSIGLAMKTETTDGKLGRINLARKSGQIAHADGVVARMSNLSGGVAAGSHPLGTVAQMAAEKGGYVGRNRPKYSRGFHQAVASNDARGAANTRNDQIFALAGCPDLATKELPFTLDDKFRAIKKFNLLNHPDYGRYPMFTAEYDILFRKLINKLGVKGVTSSTPPDRYKKLTSIKLSKSELESFSPADDSQQEALPEDKGSIIAMPGSAEFRQTEQDLRSR